MWTQRDRFGDEVVCVRMPDGSRHERRLDYLDDEDAQDARIASSFLRHQEAVLALKDRPSTLTYEQIDAAATTDFCLAVERMFPHLREALPA